MNITLCFEPLQQIIHLEFAHYDFDNQGTIAATDFGLSMAASADLSKINHYLDRVQDLATNPHFAQMRISLEVRLLLFVLSSYVGFWIWSITFYRS